MDTKKKTERERTFTWEDPFLTVRSAPGKTGLELINEVFSGKLPPPPVTEALGFVGVEAKEGWAAFEGDPAEYAFVRSVVEESYRSASSTSAGR